MLCVYAPNVVSEREEFFRGVLPFLETDKTVILLGDFNCVSEATDSAGQNVYIDGSARVLEGFLNDFDLVDVGKIKASSGNLSYTCFQGSSLSKLDRIYISVSVSNDIGTLYVATVPFSDH